MQQIQRPIAEFFIPLITQLEKLAQQERLDFNTLEEQAFAQASTLLAAKRLQAS
jgi:hypothetical protein